MGGKKFGRLICWSEEIHTWDNWWISCICCCCCCNLCRSCCCCCACSCICCCNWACSQNTYLWDIWFVQHEQFMDLKLMILHDTKMHKIIRTDSTYAVPSKPHMPPTKPTVFFVNILTLMSEMMIQKLRCVFCQDVKVNSYYLCSPLDWHSCWTACIFSWIVCICRISYSKSTQVRND